MSPPLSAFHDVKSTMYAGSTFTSPWLNDLGVQGGGDTGIYIISQSLESISRVKLKKDLTILPRTTTVYKVYKKMIALQFLFLIGMSLFLFAPG